LTFQWKEYLSDCQSWTGGWIKVWSGLAGVKNTDISWFPLQKDTGTVKASNVAHHGNFGPIFARSVTSLDDFCTNHEQNKFYKSKLFQQLIGVQERSTIVPWLFCSMFWS
jgi:hypothetical protein